MDETKPKDGIKPQFLRQDLAMDPQAKQPASAARPKAFSQCLRGARLKGADQRSLRVPAGVARHRSSGVASSARLRALPQRHDRKCGMSPRLVSSWPEPEDP